MGLIHVHGCIHTEVYICTTIITDGSNPKDVLAHGMECRKAVRDALAHAVWPRGHKPEGVPRRVDDSRLRHRWVPVLLLQAVGDHEERPQPDAHALGRDDLDGLADAQKVGDNLAHREVQTLLQREPGG